MYERLADFYNGKSIFLTGAPGFLGSVMMEILLRCFPGINQIYILVRPKKGVSPNERKNIIFQKKIFSDLLAKHPDIVDKVKVVSGDVTLPHLGISEEDMSKIIQNVSIVFHCAASISFGMSLELSVQTNTLGAVKAMELCRKLKTCEAFVYTSTCYSNTHLPSETIEEKIYKLPFTAEKFLNELKHGDVKQLLDTLAKYNYKWPNTYTFSKSLAENILAEKAYDLPVVIVRPSIIHSTVGGPKPGYAEKGLAVMSVTDAIAKGILQVLPGDPNATIDIIGCDIVANFHLAAAFYMANKRCASPFIVICSSGNIWNVKEKHFCDTLLRFSKKNILPNALQEASLIIVKKGILYELLHFYVQIIPAFLLDIGRCLRGLKPKYVSFQQRLYSYVSTMDFFFSEHLSFKSDNTEELSRLLHPEDKHNIYIDTGDYKFDDMIFNVTTGSSIYDWEKDKLSPRERKSSIIANTMLATFLRRITLFLFIYIMYVIVKKVLF